MTQRASVDAQSPSRLCQAHSDLAYRLAHCPPVPPRQHAQSHLRVSDEPSPQESPHRFGSSRSAALSSPSSIATKSLVTSLITRIVPPRLAARLSGRPIAVTASIKVQRWIQPQTPTSVRSESNSLRLDKPRRLIRVHNSRRCLRPMRLWPLCCELRHPPRPQVVLCVTPCGTLSGHC